eukprot:6170913-Alexandrium_andersonii.AAC.1
MLAYARQACRGGTGVLSFGLPLVVAARARLPTNDCQVRLCVTALMQLTCPCGPGALAAVARQ